MRLREPSQNYGKSVRNQQITQLSQKPQSLQYQPKRTILLKISMFSTLSLFLCISPVRICVANFKDLMMVATIDLMRKITQIMQNLSKEYNFNDYDTHVAKSGFFMVEVNILTSQGCKLESVRDFDMIRERIQNELNIPSYKIWLSVSFTANPKWL